MNITSKDDAMSAANDKIIEDALSLPVHLRISLLENLIKSLNLPTDDNIDRLWAEEAERRISQVEANEAELVPGEKVFARIRAKYGK